MELVSFVREVAQNAAERFAASRLGQSALRQCDRALWVLEKCARWAVPPPLDQDERPQPELIRPLPWPLFLVMLLTLRVMRESISLVNLVLGKPPLRSADVVMFIQSKRRYLRTLKYQGSRTLRARGTQAPAQPWYNGLRSLLEFTMCFPRSNYGNNNTTRVSNNDEVLVVKRSKRQRQPRGPSPADEAAGEAVMERLIERMMVELDADSDDDSSYTLTNATSIRSDRSEYETGSEDDTLENLNMSGGSVPNNDSPDPRDLLSSTPEKAQNNGDSKTESQATESDGQGVDSQAQVATTEPRIDTIELQAGKMESKIEKTESQIGETESQIGKIESQPGNSGQTKKKSLETLVLAANENFLRIDESLKKQKLSPKTETKNFLQNERSRKSPQKSPKFANGRVSGLNKHDRSPSSEQRF